MFTLEVSGLSKSYNVGFLRKEIQVLKNLNFSIRTGVTTGFVGVNGSGKTTTLKCLMDFIRPDAGVVHFFGSPLNLQSKQKIGYLPERPYLYDFLTGKEFLQLHWDLCQSESEKGQFLLQSQEVLQRVNLLEAQNKKLRTYSKGMLQRIGIAQAILTKPEFIIFDEPMSGLDPDGRMLVKEILRQEKVRGATIFFSSHLLQDMEELCEDLLVIDNGQVVFTGRLKDFQQSYAGLEAAFEDYRRKNPKV